MATIFPPHISPVFVSQSFQGSRQGPGPCSLWWQVRCLWLLLLDLISESKNSLCWPHSHSHLSQELARALCFLYLGISMMLFTLVRTHSGLTCTNPTWGSECLQWNPLTMGERELMDECLFWLITRWTILRLYVHVLTGIKLHSQSDDLDNTLILPFLPSFFSVLYFYSLGSPPRKLPLHNLLSQAQLSWMGAGGTQESKNNFYV